MIPDTQSSSGIPPVEHNSRLRRLLRSVTVDVRILRRREYRLLVIGRGVSTFGSMISMVALPYQVYHLTGSPLAVGLLGLSTLVPILLLAFVGGALADARDRRNMVRITELGLAVVSAALAGNALLPHPQVWLLYVISALMAGGDALQRPSLDALIPRLVEREDLTAASALSALYSTADMIAGPAIAGLLIAGLGVPITYGIDVLTFLVSLVALGMMRAVPPPPDAEPPTVQRVLEGLHYARSRPDLIGSYLVDILAMFFGMPEALFPAIAGQYGGAQALGFLYAAPAAGAFLASATSGWSRRVHRHGLAILLAALTWGAGITAFGISRSLPLAVAGLAVAGGADMVSGIFRGTLWNATIPDSIRGRMAGIELISYSSGPALGDVESGLVATIAGVRVSVISGGVLCMVGALAVGLALPAFLRYDDRHRSADASGNPPKEGTTPVPEGRDSGLRPH